jgi:DNA-binding NtrC family response regulator
MPTVLIIDEREAVRTALEILLSLNGHDAICTSGPEDGLRAIATEAVDLVVLQAERSDEHLACETRP